MSLGVLKRGRKRRRWRSQVPEFLKNWRCRRRGRGHRILVRAPSLTGNNFLNAPNAFFACKTCRGLAGLI